MRGPGRRACLRATLWALGALWALAAANDEAWPECDQRSPWQGKGQCVTDYIPCLENQLLLEGRSVCGCCPGCVDTIEEDGECSEKSLPCQFNTFCNGGVCKKGVCAEMMDKYTENQGSWTPSCDRSGSYESVQCKGRKGDGRCFCWSPDGERLFGEADWTDSTDMHCACSLRAWELAQQEEAEEAPRCAPDGSFEALQCARGVCWCADARSGAPLRRAVPEGAAHMLFCYKAAEVGDSYRRRCDSQLEARTRIQEVMEAHGTAAHGLPNADCDLDGSFRRVQYAENGGRICTEKDKQQIGGYMQANTESTEMNCNCARDSVTLDNHNMRCVANGNYDPRQNEGSEYYCVDKDGYFARDTKYENDNCND